MFIVHCTLYNFTFSYSYTHFDSSYFSSSSSFTFRYFTLLDVKNPVTVRASLGPLNVKKTLYPSSLTSSIDHRFNKQPTINVTTSTLYNSVPNVIATQQQQLQLESQFKHQQSKNSHGHNLVHSRSNSHRSITSTSSGVSAFNEHELASRLSNSLPDHPSNNGGKYVHGNKKLHQQQHFHQQQQTPYVQQKIEVLDMESVTRQVTAHLVTTEVTRNKPVLRILFHSGFGVDSPVHSHPHPHHHSYSSYASYSGVHNGHRNNLCVIVSITDSSHGKVSEHSSNEDTVYSFCSLNDASSTCVTSTILPASWFPPVTVDSSSNRPPKGSMVKISYSIVRSTIGCNESTLGSLDQLVSPYLIKSLSKDVQDAIAVTPVSNVFVHIFDVPLNPFRGSYEEVTADDMVKILVPQAPIYPMTQIYIPVVFKVNPSYPISAFSVRIRIKSGLKVIGAILAPNSLWSISLEISPKGNAATVTAYLKDDEEGQMMSHSTNGTLGDSTEDIIDTEDESTNGGGYEEDYLSDASTKWSKEQLITLRKIHLLDRMGTSQTDVFSWLLQVEDMADVSDNGRVVWQLIYLTDSLQTNGPPVPVPVPVVTVTNSHPKSNTGSNLNLPSMASPAVDSSKLTTKFDIRKDEVEKLIGITSTSEMLNTAVLTGKQISNLLKIYAISYSGKVGDVTLQSSCHSFDESVIKVSPSCSSIYLDGTEIRGSFNASIWIKYGSTYTGIVSFKIWMPKFPLEITTSDSKLSQIKSWKVPSTSFISMVNAKSGHHSSHILSNFDETDFQGIEGDKIRNKKRRNKRHQKLNIRIKRGQSDFETGESSSSSCRLKYQQSYLTISAKFTATDSKNGRETYYVSRRASFNVDHLVGPFIRIADPRIAYLYTSDSGHIIVEGMSNGRTDIQIVSPITGTIIGKKEIKVTPEKESITRLEVSLVTGLNMNVTKLPPINVGGANTYYTVKLTTNLNYFTSKFQEGFLLTQIYFSDGTSMYLNDIEANNYFLTIDLFDTNSLAVVPPVNGPSIGPSDTSSSHSGSFNDGKFYYPRVIALAHGKDQLIHVALEMPLTCQRKRTQQLALKYLNVNIDLNSAIQNDHKDGHSISHTGKSSKVNSGKSHPYSVDTVQVSRSNSGSSSNGRNNDQRNSFLREILTNPSGKSHSGSKSAWRFVSGHTGLNNANHLNTFSQGSSEHISNLDENDLENSLDGVLPSMTPIEIGIYAVLSFFTIAVMIFVASCMIFTFKTKSHYRGENSGNNSSSDHHHRQLTDHNNSPNGGQLDDICGTSNNAAAAAAAISMASAAGVAVASAKSVPIGSSSSSSKVSKGENESKPPPIPIRTTSQNNRSLDKFGHLMINFNPSMYHRQLQQMCQVSGHQLTSEQRTKLVTSSQFTSPVVMSPKAVVMDEELNEHTKGPESMTPMTPVVPIAQDWVFLVS